MDEQERIDLLREYQDRVVDLGVDVPVWIDQNIRADQVGELLGGGDCVTYMGAALHSKALETMRIHGYNYGQKRRSGKLERLLRPRFSRKSKTQIDLFS